MKKIVNIELRTNHLIETFDSYKFNYSYYIIEFNYFCDKNMWGIDVEIRSEKEYKDIVKFFLILDELLFLNYSCFFTISRYFEDGISTDFTKYINLDYLIPSNQNTINNSIAKISETINSNSIKEHKKLKDRFHYGLTSLFYLKCYRYENLLYEHKFCMLSQICEGYIESGPLEAMVNNGVSHRIGFKDRINYYIQELDYLNKKYNVSIYKTMKIKRKTLLNQITTSRHALSHYVKILDKKGKNQSKLNVYNFIFTYFILEYLLRIIMLKELGVKPDSVKIKEGLYILHDYIYSVVNENDLDVSNYKSNLYKLNVFNL